MGVVTSSGSAWKQTPALARALWIVGVLAIAVGWALDSLDTWEAVAAVVGPLGILGIFVGVAVDLRKRSHNRT